MDNPNGQNIPSQSNEDNKSMNTQSEEEKINTDSNQISENVHVQDNSNIDIENKNEEEKNNEEEQEILRKKKEQEEINKRKAQRQAQLQYYEKNYNNLMEKIKSQWNKDKQNYDQFYDNQISKSISNIVNLPCIILNKEIIAFAFKFLCKFYSFLKDNFKDIPLNIMNQVCYFYNNNIFYKNPKNVKINNQIDQENYNLIGDSFFYHLFKELLPEAEVENIDYNGNYNCMIKYFSEYLFHSGYNKKFITDFLSREDLSFENYIFFCDYSFQNLVLCDNDFIKKNDYNILIIRNFIQKMNNYLAHSQEYIKEKKNLFLENINNLSHTYFNKIFGGLTRMIDIFLQNNLENEIEEFFFCILKPFEILLKQQKLELRIVGISQLSNIVNLYKADPNFLIHFYYDYESTYEYSKKKLLQFLQKINLFDLIFGENIHEAIIERSYDTLSFLYRNGCFTPNDISLLWKISQNKYQSISNSIISLFGRLLPEFSNNDCSSILQTVSNMNYNEVNEITLKLLENFFISQQRHENLLNILYKYSNELSFYEGLSSTIINKSRNILIKLLFNKNYVNDLHQCIKNCLFSLDNNYLLNTNRTIFIEIMNEFIRTDKTENTIEVYKLIDGRIQNFGKLIKFLDEKYSMFDILMNNLLFMKKIFVFFSEEAIRLKNIINKGNFDFESLLDINKLMLKYKEYEKSDNNRDDNKMDIESENNIININNHIQEENNINIISHLLPKNKNDIEKYLKLIMNDFILFFKNKLLKEKISLSDEEIQFKIFTQFEFSFEKNTYQKIINKIMEIIFTYHQIGNIFIKRNILDILYQLLVNNSAFKGESEIFFNFIKNIINIQINNFHLSLITEEDIEYLCLEKICSNEIVNLPFPAYEAISQYIIYINEKNGNISYNKDTKKFINIKNINLLIGFKTYLEFFIVTKNPKIYTNSFATISNILEISASDMINRKYILDELFKLLDSYKTKIKEKENNAIEKVSFRRLLRLISIINKTKVSKNLYDKNDEKNILNLNIVNNFFFNNGDNISFKVFKGLTINELKNEIINSLICNDQNNLMLFNNLMNYPHPPISSLEELKNEIIRNNLIIIYYNSQVLKNDFTLADYNINSNETILILNGAGADLNGQEFQMNDEQLKEAYQQIRVVFNEKYSEEVMKEALYKEKGDIQNAILFLANQENAVNLMKEMEIRKKNEPQKKEELICLEENKFNILLDILNEGDNDINSSVWDLFSEIKFQDKFILNSIGSGFDNILGENNLNKKILILKIINSVIFDDETFCKNNKLTKNIKNQWIFNFINNKNFISQILMILSQLKIDEIEQISYSKFIYIIINWFLKIFTKIIDLIKNKKNTNNNIDDSGSNFNIITDNEESKNNENANEDVYGEFEILENDINNFIEILTKCNFVSSIYGILGVVLEFKKMQIQTEKKNIIKNLFEILVDYLQIKPKEIIQFLEQEEKLKQIEKIMMFSQEIEIRKSTLNFIKSLMENVKLNSTDEEESKDNNKAKNINIQIFLLQIITPKIISDEIYYEEFYELYNYLINCQIIKTKDFNIEQIITKFFFDFYNFYIHSKNINSEIKENNDNEQLEKIKSKMEFNLYVLCSFYPFYSELIEKQIEEKLKENKDIVMILYNCLFVLDKYKTNNNINFLFSSDKLREKAFNLLSIIISIDKKYFVKILPKIIIQHTEILPKKNGLPIFFPLRNFATEKFIGLKNFGATCYLNSLFQQMFMIPTFYKDLFQFNISNENKNENDKENDDLKYSTIYNMQLTFINLKKSCMPFYPPLNFIKSFKTAFNGEEIHLSVQQDTDEFLAILCDELEKEAKKFGKENFLENSFKGKITNEIVSLEKEFPYYSQTEEPFNRITLDIKGHKNLEDALDAYVKGEILDGDNQYFVEKYNKKISIKKRVSIKKIGNEIIIHLKRFEFDFLTFQNNKLNDYLKFPLQINFKKWTRAYLRMNEVGKDNNNESNIISEEEKENLDDEKMNYELTGILIHSGASLQSGHYYSFIKDQESNKWYKFNDSNISEYDIDKDLEKECFGNLDSKKNQYGKGAYLLFYTKKECINSYKNFEKNIKINENILKQVENENIEFLKLKSFVEESYKNFLCKFIRCSLNYLKGIEINNKNDKDFSMLMNKGILREIKIYDKLITILKGNKENNIDINDEEIKTLPDNIEEIYEKCKTEIIYIEKDEKKDKIIIDNEIITTKNITKLLFYFTFGIIFQYNDKDTKLNDVLTLLFEILQQNQKYSLFILKNMEKKIDMFIELLFKYGYTDKEMMGINLTINSLYKILFDAIYNFEREKYGKITNETFYVFEKDKKGKLKIEKEYKSLFLRMFKKLFCNNLEKCRIEYLRENLFLDLFNAIIASYPEASIVSSNYLLTLASLITNNSVQMLKSEVNPNFKMGNNNQNYISNFFYTSSFCNTILRCITPGMIMSNKKSPYFISRFDFNQENPDFSSYPKIPENWDKYLEQYFFNFIFNASDEPVKIIFHTCFFDKKNSCNMMKFINNHLRNQWIYLINIDNIILRACQIFNLNDGLNEMRLQTLFELDLDEINKEPLFQLYYRSKDNCPNIVALGIYVFAKIISQYQVVFDYFIKNKNNVEWIKDYYAIILVNIEDKKSYIYKNLEKTLEKYPDLLQVIENEFINKLEL